MSSSENVSASPTASAACSAAAGPWTGSAGGVGTDSKSRSWPASDARSPVTAASASYAATDW